LMQLLLVKISKNFEVKQTDYFMHPLHAKPFRQKNKTGSYYC